MANFFPISASHPHMAPRRKQKQIYHPKQTLQNMSQITSLLLIPLLKKLTLLVLSFSLFSLLFLQLHPSWLPFPHLSTFSWQFLLRGANKNYIFLLCNGLLVLVAKYSYWTLKTHSVPFSSSQTITPLEDLLMYKGYDLEPSTDISAQFGWGETIFPEYVHSSISSHVAFQESSPPPDQTEPSHLENDAVTEKKEEERKRSEENREGLDGEVGQFLMITYSNHKGVEEKSICGHCHEHDDYKVKMEEPEKEVYIEEDEYDEEEGEIGKMSTEELNKKIEDFIRKRKEELRIEAQQQLILVYD